MEKLKQFPLTEATYLILLSLVKPLHGYGIMQKIETMSKRRVKMGPGTLYGGLSSLVEKKMIKRVDDTMNDDRKKMYRITDLGLDILEKEYLRLTELVGIGNVILEGRSKND